METKGIIRYAVTALLGFYPITGNTIPAGMAYYVEN